MWAPLVTSKSTRGLSITELSTHVFTAAHGRTDSPGWNVNKPVAHFSVKMAFLWGVLAFLRLNIAGDMCVCWAGAISTLTVWRMRLGNKWKMVQQRRRQPVWQHHQDPLYDNLSSPAAVSSAMEAPRTSTPSQPHSTCNIQGFLCTWCHVGRRTECSHWKDGKAQNGFGLWKWMHYGQTWLQGFLVYSPCSCICWDSS